MFSSSTSNTTGASRNRVALEKHGITHIINWSNSAKCNLFDDKFIYLCIGGVRGSRGMNEHLEDLDKAVDLIDEVRRKGGKVLRSVVDIVHTATCTPYLVHSYYTFIYFYDNHITKHHLVLSMNYSHCWWGKNRSVTLIDAYLMKYEGMQAEEANDLVKKTRPQAKPYFSSLAEYSRTLENFG